MPTDLLPIPAENVLRIVAVDGRFLVVCRKHGALMQADRALVENVQRQRPPCPQCIAEMFDA